MNKMILYLILKYRGNWLKIFQTLETKELIDSEHFKDVYEKITSGFISIVDRNYPYFLKETYKPPFGIFYLGEIRLLSHKLFTIIGNLNQAKAEILTFLINEGYYLLIELNKPNVDYFYTSSNSMLIKYVIFVAPNGLQHQTTIDSYKTSAIKTPSLLVSEIPTNNINHDPDQSFYRLLIGLSKKVLLVDTQNIKNHKNLLCYCLNENVQVYKQICQPHEKEILGWNDYNVNLFKTNQQLKQLITYKN